MFRCVKCEGGGVGNVEMGACETWMLGRVKRGGV